MSSYAGNWRPAGIEIKGSKHQPVGVYLVPEEIEHMCDYVNDNWEKSSPLHLAAYALWKLNWIHPFTDGNGRTALQCPATHGGICHRGQQSLDLSRLFPRFEG